MSTETVEFEVVEETLEFNVVEEVIEFNMVEGVPLTIAYNYFIEQLIGIIDNANKTFTTTFDYVNNLELVFINGIKQRNGVDYTKSAVKTVLFDEAPRNVGFTDYLEIIYIKV